MTEDTNQTTSSSPVLCTQCMMFYGNAICDNMCSQCYKTHGGDKKNNNNKNTETTRITVKENSSSSNNNNNSTSNNNNSIKIGMSEDTIQDDNGNEVVKANNNDLSKVSTETPQSSKTENKNENGESALTEKNGNIFIYIIT